jgi:hypothetical protein
MSHEFFYTSIFIMIGTKVNHRRWTPEKTLFIFTDLINNIITLTRKKSLYMLLPLLANLATICFPLMNTYSDFSLHLFKSDGLGITVYNWLILDIFCLEIENEKQKFVACKISF